MSQYIVICKYSFVFNLVSVALQGMPSDYTNVVVKTMNGDLI